MSADPHPTHLDIHLRELSIISKLPSRPLNKGSPVYRRTLISVHHATGVNTETKQKAFVLKSKEVHRSRDQNATFAGSIPVFRDSADGCSQVISVNVVVSVEVNLPTTSAEPAMSIVASAYCVAIAVFYEGKMDDP